MFLAYQRGHSVFKKHSNSGVVWLTSMADGCMRGYGGKVIVVPIG